MKRRMSLLTIAVIAGVTFVGAGSAAAKRHAKPRHGKKAYVTFTTTTEVGNLTLKPGHYLLLDLVKGSDHFMTFTQVRQSDAAPYPIARPVEVKCTLEPLAKKVDGMQMDIVPDGSVSRVTKIKVAGEKVAHVF